MPSRLTFGAILAEAREHKGMDVTAAARRLRIRPDILRAIEAEDFSRMPPRGYTRNMISAYARLVGLNPNEICRMYLDEAYAFQVGKARSDAMPRVEGSSRRTRRDTGRSSRHVPYPKERPPRQNALGRTVYDDRRSYTRGDYDAPQSQPSGRRSHHTHPTRHTAMPRSQYTNFYAGPRGNGSMQSRLPFVIAGVIILVLLIVILFLVFGPKESQDNSGNTIVPITGLDDTTQTNGDSQSQDETTQPALTAPTSAVVNYRVVGDDDVYVEISVDGGDIEERYLEPGTDETVEVTGTWSLGTWTTDKIEITLDGEPVESTQQGSSIPTFTVDYEAYLSQWITDHPGATATQPTAEAPNEDSTAEASEE